MATQSANPIYEALKIDIVKQRFLPGQHLPEQELAKRFGVSRTPVRQVLQQLAAEGFVEFVPYRGAQVKRLSPEELKDLFQVRMALERTATELLGEVLTPHLVKELQDNIKQSQQAVDLDDARLYASLDQEFHNLIVSGCGNKELQTLVEHLNQRSYIFRLRSMTLPGQMKQSCDEHQLIVQQLLAGELEEAGRSAANHVKGALERFSKFLELEQMFIG